MADTTADKPSSAVFFRLQTTNMTITKLAFNWAIALLLPFFAVAQQRDSSLNTTVFSGSVGVTTNGFSIVPTFSLNSSAGLFFLSWKKNKFSIDPDIRLTPDGRKGGILLWFRYQAVDEKKFSLRVGAHPALNFQIRKITDNNTTTSITQMRRFLAGEVAPTYHITKNWNVGVYYLQGHGLQKDGPQTTHFITLNSGIANIKLGGPLRLAINGAVYYLRLDGYEGRYYTATTTLSHTKIPFSLQGAMNKTIRSNLPGNKDFLSTVTLFYNFSKTFYRVK
ncbi:MAG: hypothetical protein WBP45_13720 [Daejeonella sp.]